MTPVLIVHDPEAAARAEAWPDWLTAPGERRSVGRADDLLRAVREAQPRLLVACGAGALRALPLEWPADVRPPVVLADLRGWCPQARDSRSPAQQASDMRGFALALARADRVLCDGPEHRAVLAWAARSAGAAWGEDHVHAAAGDALPESLKAWLDAPQPARQPESTGDAPAELGRLPPAARLQRAQELLGRALRTRVAPHP
ncbi:MAG: hypothetical protein R3233_09245, partial [Xanthomonadales bacterium]|nr:hypothetical protein [Xanthomonadales bacterium]